MEEKKKKRTEAQRRADERYYKKTKGRRVLWGVNLFPEEAAAFNAVVEQTGMTRADFLREVMSKKSRKNGELVE